MDRAQFMEQLKRLLSGISASERQEALDYYESYFDDAGKENEAAIIRELGSPGKVAAIIKADLSESNDRYAEYTELGYEDIRAKEPGQVPDKYTAVASGGTAGKKTESSDASGAQSTERKFGRDRAGADSSGAGATGAGSSGADRAGSSGAGGAGGREQGRQRAYGPGQQQSGGSSESRAERGYHAEKKRNNAAIILVLILLVFLAPLIKGAVGGVLGVIVTIALLPFLIVFALGAGALGLVIAAIVCAVTGIGLCFSYPAAGIVTLGIACLMMAVGIVCLVLLVWLAGKLLPKLLRKFTDFCYRMLHKGRKGGADV